MPIKVTCTCGQTLAAPDNLAGKAVKCPKCQAAVKIPTAAAAVSPATKTASAQPKPAAPAKSAGGTKPAAAPAPSATKAAVPKAAPKPVANDDSVFDDIGLKRRTGPICPKCQTSITATTALCTKCGFNLQTGEQLAGFSTHVTGPEFDNPFLQEAADNMRRDTVSQSRHDKAGTPWWMLMAMLLGALCLAAAGVIIVDGFFNPADPSTFMGKLQKQPIMVTIGVTLGAVAGLISTFAHLSVVAFAFSRGAGPGFGCLLIPFFSMVYSIKHWADNKSAVIAVVWSMVIGGIAGACYFPAGGWKL